MHIKIFIQKIFNVCFLLWFIPFTLYSQRYISGRITDAEDGTPIPAVTVFFTNTTIGITTDIEGNYQLKIPGEGSYRLTISHVGYQTVFMDIEPGKTSIQFNVAMQIQELDEVIASAGIRFRQRDINLFWSKILGENPSKSTIRATNPEMVYYYYNPETRILKVTCREPLEIINYKTGYHILYLLDSFSHDYNTDITNWDYQSVFTELEPANTRQKNIWEKNRREVYNVSITKFIKSLYNNTLMNDGFVLTPLHTTVQHDARRGMSDRFGESALINLNDILLTQSSENSKILNLVEKQILLICYGKPVTNYDIANLPSVRSGGQKWEQTNRGIYRNLLQGDMIRIFPDGTYMDRLYLSSIDLFNPLLMGLCMTLPIDYLSETDKAADNFYLFDFDDIYEHFDKQLEDYPQEKIHLHTDRNDYVQGEKIRFKAYVTDAETLQYPTFSRYVYVELISPNDTLVNRVMVRQNDNMFYGYMPIAEVVPEGNYTLRAYTRYMENLGDDYFFKKNIRIGTLNRGNRENMFVGATLAVAQEDFDVSFFPEGGNLVEGVLCKVAFKALNRSGQSAIISGKLIDDTGIEITDVKTLHGGMGVIFYTPLPGKKYYLKCRNENGLEKQFELPPTNPLAYTLTSSSKGNNLFIEVQRSANAPEMLLYLLAHCRGMVLHFAAWEKEKRAIVFEQDRFPAGVIQFVLFDGQMNPLSERLVFNTNYDEEMAQVEFLTDKESYEKREKVVVAMSLSTSLGNDVEQYLRGNAIAAQHAHLSLSVTDDNDISVDSSTTILSSLLLSSELKGYIENPAYYLQDNTASNAALDLLMMTHGWRRYNVPEVVKGNPAYPTIPFQESQTISGNVKSLVLSRPVVDSEVIIMSEEYGVETASTDKDGFFAFQELEFPDSTSFFIQVLDRRGRDNVQIVINDEQFPEPIDAPQSPHLTPTLSKGEEVIKEGTESNALITKAEQRAKYDEEMRLIYLDEVAVTASRINRSDPRLQFYANTASDQTITREEIDKMQITNFAVYTPLGYQKPVEFYSPQYETLEAKHLTIPDYRTTIFWKPDVVISYDEEVTVEFYTSDFPTIYSVVIEGLTIDGKIIRQVEKIRIE